MNPSRAIPVFLLFIALVFVVLGAGVRADSQTRHDRSLPGGTEPGGALDNALRVQYLEIVTPLVDETCKTLAGAHGVEFGKPVPELGNARTADLRDGGRIGVRAPMRSTEEPVVRPYLLVADIEAAVRSAEHAGATVAVPPMKIPGQGTFSIYILGGIEHGLWQL